MKEEHLINPILKAVQKKIATREKLPAFCGNEIWESTVVILKPIELYQLIVKHKDKNIAELYAALTEEAVVSSVEI